MDLRAYLTGQGRRVDAALDEYLPPLTDNLTALPAAMRYSVFAGGKRLRPILALAAAEALGTPPEAILPAAGALELIHTYSLIHDDLPAMDNDDYRRGKLTCHKVYGEAMAILAGDALLTLAFELLTQPEAPAATKLTVVREVAAAAGPGGLVGGQAADIGLTGQAADSATIEYIHRHKTGDLIRASVRLGAHLAGANASQLAGLTSYAEHLGLGYQIMDDILDVVGDPAKLGKKVRKDAAQGKNTFPARFGLEAAKAMAEAEAAAAETSLDAVGGDTTVLAAIADYIVRRDS